MEQKRLAARVLVFLLAILSIGGTGVLASAPASGSSRDYFLPDTVLAEPGWEQVGGNGLGDVDATEVSAVAAFGSYVYAGTHNAIDGALILRSPDGMTWSAVIDPGFGNPHDTAPLAIVDLTVFNGYLYASTGLGQDPAKIWRTSSGSFWAPVVNNGFSDAEIVDIPVLAEYNGMLYAAANNRVSGAQVWRSYTGDSNSWTQDSPAVLVAAPAAGITGMAVFGGGLYAAIESEGPAQIWRTYGGAWTAAVSDGFGDEQTILTGGMVVFGGYLYVGAGNTSSGAQLWRTNDGDTWVPVVTPGSGDPNNQVVESIFVFQNQLYAGVSNATTGIEVWHTADGTVWEQSNQDGFGDSNNVGTNANSATAEFAGRLYTGTANAVDGGELWRLTPASLPSYGLELSPDSSLSGLPGTTVTHTLTVANTGTVADTYSLAISGNTWATSLSAASIAIAPGASAQFDVSVTIPPSALAADADIVSVTATSQGDVSKSAASQLTTGVLPVYGVALSPDDSLGGLPGSTVTYTLTISNAGNTADTYHLVVGSSAWDAVLSSTSEVLAPGASAQFDVSVAIPPSALAADGDSAVITATSQGDPAQSDSVSLATGVLPVYGVALSADAALSGLPGTTVTYNATLTNTGNVTSTVQLAASGNVWPATLTATNIDLGPGASSPFSVAVTIPAGALAGAVDTATVTATVEGDGSATDSATLTTTCLSTPPQLDLDLFLPLLQR